MPFIDLFSSHAKQYALARPQYPDALFDWIASQSPGNQAVWDCGTGNGQAARSLADRFKQVYATDPSAEQIAEAPAVRNVIYRVEPAERTSLPDHGIDAICVAQALHWFDFETFFAEVRRVAAPGACFAAWGYSWFSISHDFDATFRTAILDPIAAYWPSRNQLVWDGYTGIPFPFPRLTDPGFQILVRWNFGDLMAFVKTWSATRRCLADRGDAFFESALRQLMPLWGESARFRTITMPLVLLAGRIP